MQNTNGEKTGLSVPTYPKRWSRLDFCTMKEACFEKPEEIAAVSNSSESSS